MIPRFIDRLLLEHHYIFGPRDRIHIDKTARVHDALFNTISGKITIGPFVLFGHRVSVITGTHDYSKKGHERMLTAPQEGMDIDIREGVWVGTNAVIVGPCILGPHMVVGAGSVVTNSFPEGHVVVAGNPARVIKKIE